MSVNVDGGMRRMIGWLPRLCLVLASLPVFQSSSVARSGELAAEIDRLPVAREGLQDGLALVNAGKSEEAIILFAELFNHYRDAEDPELRWIAAIAMRHSCMVNMACDDMEYALQDLDFVIDAFQDDPEDRVRVHAATALLTKAGIFEIQKREAERLHAYEEVLSRYGSETSRDFWLAMGWAALGKGRMQRAAGDAAGALKTIAAMPECSEKETDNLLVPDMVVRLERARAEAEWALAAARKVEAVE